MLDTVESSLWRRSNTPFPQFSIFENCCDYFLQVSVAASLDRVQSQEAVCDDVTRKLVGAITTWHDIHSNLLRLSIGLSSLISVFFDHGTSYPDASSQLWSITLHVWSTGKIPGIGNFVYFEWYTLQNWESTAL